MSERRVPRNGNSETEIKRPKKLSAERAILGAILLDNSKYQLASAILKPQDFSVDLYQKMFSAIGEMITERVEGRKIDLVTLTEYMAVPDGTLDAAGIAQVFKDNLIASNVEHYARIVREKSARWQAITIFNRGILQALDEDGEDADSVRDSALADLKAITVASAGRRRTFESLTPRQLMDSTPELPEYIIYPVLVRGFVSLLDGLPKWSGKTTLALTGLLAMSDNRPFLGRKTERTRVLYVSEENRKPLRIEVARAGLADSPYVEFVPLDLHAGIPWREKMEIIEGTAVDKICAGCIVDTFFECVGATKEQENDAGFCADAVRPVREMIARLNMGAGLFRHERKSPGEIGTSGRGSNALTGAVDQIVRLTRMNPKDYPTNFRKLEILGRIEQAELTIELVNQEYRVHGDAAPVEKQDNAAAIVAAIKAKPSASLREIARVTNTGKTTVERLAKESGFVQHDGRWIDTEHLNS